MTKRRINRVTTLVDRQLSAYPLNPLRRVTYYHTLVLIIFSKALFTLNLIIRLTPNPNSLKLHLGYFLFLRISVAMTRFTMGFSRKVGFRNTTMSPYL